MEVRCDRIGYNRIEKGVFKRKKKKGKGKRKRRRNPSMEKKKKRTRNRYEHHSSPATSFSFLTSHLLSPFLTTTSLYFTKVVEQASCTLGPLSVYIGGVFCPQDGFLIRGCIRQGRGRKGREGGKGSREGRQIHE